MFRSYQALFSCKGTLSFTLAGLLSRFPLPMMGIGIIMMISQIHESYAIAGAISACFVFTYAVLSPQISRLVDRHGQTKILPIFTFISLLGSGLMLLATWFLWSTWVLFAAAIMLGFMPCLSAMIRARWTAIYKQDPRLQTAYSLETVIDEVTFIIGPPISVTLSVMLFPQAGLLIAALFLLLGVFFLVLQKETEPSVIKETVNLAMPKSSSVIQFTAVKLLTLLMIALGIIVGTIDIFSVSFAQLQGQPAAASLVISAYAIGSCFAGLLFGSLTLSTPLTRLLLMGATATLITTLPLAIISSVYSLSMVMLISGLFFAPLMIVTMSLVEKVVPENQLTEGMTWLLAGLNIGIAIGAALTGQVVDYFNTQAGALVAIGASVLVLIMGWLSFQRIKIFSSC